LFVQPLPNPDAFYLDAAMGWLLLDNASEALLELNKIQAEYQNHPDVLELRWTLQATQADWTACLRTGQALVEIAPDRVSGWIHRAYALRRATDGGLTLAWEALLPAADQFPDETIIPYNLACYACQQGDLATARDWLQRAWRTADRAGEKSKWIELALHDADLELLWPEIRQSGSSDKTE
jgi:Flp pilus assembly protein TadD